LKVTVEAVMLGHESNVTAPWNVVPVLILSVDVDAMDTVDPNTSVPELKVTVLVPVL
jgi:hypothetical protein